jgi:signal transduction histidine kinase
MHLATVLIGMAQDALLRARQVPIADQGRAERDPLVDSSEPCHRVQFYATEEYLCDVVADLIGAGVEGKDPTVLVATNEHISTFEQALTEKGLEVDEAKRERRFVCLDAERTLETFMVGDTPDRSRFLAELGGVLSAVAREGCRIRVYEQMVDLLWSQGRTKAALIVEELWNELSRTHHFSLLCGYMGSFYKERRIGDELHQVCSKHTHVAPPEYCVLEAEIEHRKQIEVALRDSIADLKQAERALGASQRALKQSHDALLKLHALTTKLCRARTQRDVLDAFASAAVPAAGACAGSIVLFGEDARSLSVARSVGFDASQLQPFSSVAVDAEVPLAECVRKGVPVFAEGGLRAYLPLPIGDRTIGAIVFGFQTGRALADDEAASLESIAHQCAQALDRARLYDLEIIARREAEASERRSSFLSDAGALLASSPTYEATLGCVAKLAVPQIADRCAIELDGARYGAGEVSAPIADLRAPITARGRTFGAILLAQGPSGRAFEAADAIMAEELGRRAAIAIDNALLYREACEADRRKDEFLAMLSHELRNPLAPILTALQISRLNDTGGERERQLIERQVRYLARIVDDLLDVSRITRGRIDLRKEPMEISVVLDKALEMTSSLIRQRDHVLEIDVSRTGLVADLDPVRFAQVLANVIGNAAKYTDPHGRISIVARRDGADIALSVTDNGAGISPEMLRRIFDMFVQGERTLDRALGGLGIGLTLARSLIELHGGKITAESDGTGRGSRFVIRLPALAEVPLEIAPPEDRKVKPKSVSAQRILIVDDNEDAASLLAEVLESFGYETQVAHDSWEALSIAMRFEPTAALLDIGLPVMDGYELAQKLRAGANGNGIRLIALTGYGQESDKAKSRIFGFDAHLTKPVDLDAVLAALEA